ncbi:GtrA family protein [Hydrogenophaga sp. PAMC20947]|uniref:GtrA family protein n=1 Tax=Hydrogenophaga sp. PAMC20947 TaxID=2565558 RepID=UPI00109E2FE2|nr:GtrA family protein [Hydrogenophaga sp. PAMC20947]QCB46342.1 GtrA family protein [Hydrogenophaga sp. PAMC20947]
MISEKIKFVKFLVVGGLGAISYVGISHILTENGMQAWIASLLTYSGLIPFIYLLQRRIVFESNENHSRSFPRYLMIQLIGLSFSAICPYALEKLNVNPTLSFILVVILITSTNFILQLKWAFLENHKNEKIA